MSQPVILVPLDGSNQALSALPVAKVLGEIERATLRILHVGEYKLTAEELRARTRTRGSGARRLYNRCPHWSAGAGNSAGRGGNEAASDRHVQAQWHRAREDAGPHGDESAARCSLPSCPRPAGARCNTVAPSACLGATRRDALNQRRAATGRRTCRTKSR